MRNSWAIALSVVGVCIHFLVSSISDLCIYNSGVAFGLNSPMVLVGAAFAILLAMAVKERSEGFLWVLVIAAAGNLWDRMLYDVVCDYIWIWDFPVFNINDGIISITIITLIYRTWIMSKDTK